METHPTRFGFVPRWPASNARQRTNGKRSAALLPAAPAAPMQCPFYLLRIVAIVVRILHSTLLAYLATSDW